VRRLLLVSLLLSAGCAAVEDSPFVDWLPGDRAIVVAHRGGAHLAPENTIDAIARAAQPDVQAEVVEIDVHVTSDDVIVVSHDRTLDRVTGEGNGCDIEQDPIDSDSNGSVWIRDLTRDEVQGFDAGFCFTDLDGAQSSRGQGVVVPTLRTVLEEFPGQRFILEVKQHEPSMITPLLALVEELNAFERTCLLSFHDGDIDELRELAPDEACISMSAAGSRCFAGEDLLPFGGTPCDVGDVAVVPHESAPFDLKRSRFVGNMQSFGMPVFMFTVNDADTILGALQAGVNGVITDRPDIARARIGTPGAPAE
jgi:glycerophosphoryl diester phosphodiesterase